MTEKKFNPFREAIDFLGMDIDAYGRVVNGNRYICHCMLDVMCESKEHVNLTIQAKDHIQECLDGHICLESWLFHMGHVAKNPEQIYADQLLCQQIQAYRKAWLEHLAEQLDNGELVL